MAYPNYGYYPNYGPGYLGNQSQYSPVQPQYATNPYQNMQPVQAQAVPNTVIPPTTNKRLCTDVVMMEITMKSASKMRMRNTSWKYKMVGVE